MQSTVTVAPSLGVMTMVLDGTGKSTPTSSGPQNDESCDTTQQRPLLLFHDCLHAEDLQQFCKARLVGTPR